MGNNAPYSMSILRIIGHMFEILIKWSTIRYFDWYWQDGNRHSQRCQGRHCIFIKLSYWARFKGDSLGRPVTCLNEKQVINKIKIYLKKFIVVGHGRGCKSTRCNIKSSIPPMIPVGCKGKANFADYLSPPMQSSISVFPLF